MGHLFSDFFVFSSSGQDILLIIIASLISDISVSFVSAVVKLHTRRSDEVFPVTKTTIWPMDQESPINHHLSG